MFKDFLVHCSAFYTCLDPSTGIWLSSKCVPLGWVLLKNEITWCKLVNREWVWEEDMARLSFLPGIVFARYGFRVPSSESPAPVHHQRYFFSAFILTGNLFQKTSPDPLGFPFSDCHHAFSYQWLTGEENIAHSATPVFIVVLCRLSRRYRDGNSRLRDQLLWRWPLQTTG